MASVPGSARGAAPSRSGSALRAFRVEDTEHVIDLWRLGGLLRPWNDPHRDVARKLTVQPELFLVIDHPTDGVIATVMAGYDGHRGWMNYLAVHPEHRGRGHARRLVEDVEARLTAQGCPKASLMVRAENGAVVGFYRALGYQVDDVLALGKRLISDD